MTVLLQAKAVYYPLRLEHNLVPTVDDIESRITPLTKVLMINSPGNPSGAIIPEERLREILELARKYDLWVISDEVYDEIYFDQPPPSLQPLDTDGRVLSAFSFSKSYSMTGWRVGYLAAPAPFIEAITAIAGQLSLSVATPSQHAAIAALTGPMDAVNDMMEVYAERRDYMFKEFIKHILRAQEPTVSCVNAIAQKAAVAAVDGDQTCVADMRAAYSRRCTLVTDILDSHDVAYSRPTGAFYTMIDVSRSGMSDVDFASRMIAERRVAIVPGSARESPRRSTRGVPSDPIAR